MSKCDNCLARDFFAKVFDVHWCGEEDCPMEKCMEEDNAEETG